MKKVLFVATVVKKHIMVFHIPYLKWFKDQGYEVHVCAKNDFDSSETFKIPYCDKYYELPFERQPFNNSNLTAYKNLKGIINLNNYDIIHCHTPTGGALTRIATRRIDKNKTRVIYTAHGFHFYKKASLKNWLLFYPIEKWLAKYTDTLITINQEDYELALRKKFKSKIIKLIPGVGVDLNKFKSINNTEKIKRRIEMGYTKDDFILIYVGELSHRKNQEMLINVASDLKHRIPNLRLLLVGQGNQKNKLNQLIKEMSLEKYVELLGFRTDIVNLMSISDVAVSTSRQEGLPVNIIESMAMRLPVVATDVRGNRDLIKNKKNGFLVPLSNSSLFSESVYELYSDFELRKKIGNRNLEDVANYSLDVILNDMERVYRN